ncbi:carboxypeptidase-like regulatory domain-containing protein [Flavobacterium sp. KACC 22763]|uniref:carboxypeptidase-like regulatory domain-containing protein n=1 Tax=Flavobacterium sp. KACC 22763 TaxID=3025668 RepID=UPI002365673C|nr:carboxypeptidase-like regulatory domain-containing protein [Flavobacterium sp. KACC 22763]WDF64853.1 carboxypeptidase-like regulatory domain-containing protein [Flavobacterium sp. KACC 22763]
MNKLLLLLFVTTASFSQKIYKGNVSDKGTPIPGVSVCVVNTSRCTFTDFNGNYSIEVNYGDKLRISYLGMKTQTITIGANMVLEGKNDNYANPIISNDYVENLKKPKDSIKATQSSGDYYFDLVEYLYNYNQSLMKINRDNSGVYNAKTYHQYSKVAFQVNHDFVYSTPMRLPKYQNQFAQGRSLNGNLAYQSPQTNEIFSWGPNVSTLQYSANPSEYYPQGDIINRNSSNGNPLQLFNSNNFFQDTQDNKVSFSAQIQSPEMNILKFDFGYKTGNIVIPTSRNNEISASLKYFRTLSFNSKIDAILSYNDFENNFSNSNFGINKVIFANAVTPIHFDNHFASTLSNGLQRSYSANENNPYYLIENNLDKNKSKTISFNFNHIYSYNNYLNTFNANFQSSEIKNKNGQGFYFAEINTPNFDRRFEGFISYSLSDVFRRNFGYAKFVESKIDFRFQQRDLDRSFYSGFSAPSDIPDNGTIQNKMDVLQKRFEIFYNINGAYNISNALGSNEELTLKASSNLNYSSTVNSNFLFNYSGSAEIKRLFDTSFNFTASHTFTQTEPSLQNNNLNFNSLQYQVSQFKELRNNLELITPKNAIPTKENITNLTLTYRPSYYWNFYVEYYHKNVQDLYTPVVNLNSFNWSPDVNYKQNGVEFEIEKQTERNRDFNCGFNLNFTYYKNKVTSLNNNQTRIPFAGFADVNKNYIVGQPLGVLVGSGYLRDQNQNIVIDNEGFPMVDPQQKILGDPNPDFVVGFFNSFCYKEFSLSLSFDWSKGGEIWNGTEQTLNYYGKSQLTGNQRDITNYVFNGVTQSGDVNTKVVSFYDSNLPVEQNRWVRYGVSGVAEDAIQDASYFRLNSINLSYKSDYGIFRGKLMFTISVFMNNVFVVSKSKTAFSNNAMFGSIDTSGLEYFNSPMMKSFGSSLTVKF